MPPTLRVIGVGDAATGALLPPCNPAAAPAAAPPPSSTKISSVLLLCLEGSAPANVFVCEMTAFPARFPIAAVTLMLKRPSTELTRMGGAIARPLSSVFTSADESPLAKVAPGPAEGSKNRTVAPETA